jgi:F-type H+-transporting ATPase subunit delta
VVASTKAPSAKAFFHGKPLRAVLGVQGRGARKVTVMSSEYDLVGAQYANALVDLAQSKNALEEIHADVDALQSLFSENKELKQLMFNPCVKAEKKEELIARIGKEAGLNQYTINFLGLLLQQDRLVAVEEVFESFEIQYCKLTDTQVATVRSAVKLEQEQQFLIAKKLQELCGAKNIKVKPVIDESLIAGFVVEYGSSQIDLSVKGQLEKITAELQSQPAFA